METLQVERRAQRIPAQAHSYMPERHRIVQAGIVLQVQAGTISAIEYLKSHGIAGAVVARVLSGGRMRAEDRAILGLNAA